MTTEPHRVWTGRELAEHLQNMLTQLAEWVRYGFLARADAGTSTLPATAPPGP